MKGGAFLVIVVGLVLLWIVTTGKTKNIASSWNALTSGGTTTGGSLQIPALAPSSPTVPGLPYGTSLPLPPVNQGNPLVPQTNLPASQTISTAVLRSMNPGGGPFELHTPGFGYTNIAAWN